MKKLLYLCCMAVFFMACDKDDDPASPNKQEGFVPWWILYHDSVPTFYDFVLPTKLSLQKLNKAHPSLNDLLANTEYVEEQVSAWQATAIFQCVDSCGKICYFPKHYEAQDEYSYFYYHPWEFAWDMDVDPYEVLRFRFKGDSIFRYGYYRQGWAYEIVDSKSCGYKYDETTCTLEFEHPIKFQLIPEVKKIKVRYIDTKRHYMIFDVNERIEGAPDNVYTRMIIGPPGSLLEYNK